MLYGYVRRTIRLSDCITMMDFAKYYAETVKNTSKCIKLKVIY